MAVNEIALIVRARGLAAHCLSREALERLAEAGDVSAFARSLARLGSSIEPIGEPPDVFAVERAISRTANRHFRTMCPWQEQSPGALDVFAAYQDRRSLRAIMRGAVEGRSPHARLEGLFATPSLLQPVLAVLADQTSPVDVIRQLLRLGHADAARLMAVVRTGPADLLAIDVALLAAFAARARTAAARADHSVAEFVTTMIDTVNAQNAIVIAGEPRDLDPADLFVNGGRWLSLAVFISAATGSSQQAVTTLARTLSRSPLAPLLPVVSSDVINLDRVFLSTMLKRFTRVCRVDPLSYAPLLRALLLIDAQSRDLRMLAWGAALGTPVPVRRQQLLTRS